MCLLDTHTSSIIITFYQRRLARLWCIVIYMNTNIRPELFPSFQEYLNAVNLAQFMGRVARDAAQLNDYEAGIA